MTKPLPQDAVDAAMQPMAEFDVPPVLRASIERQGQGLLALASSLLNSGMDEEHVRSVVAQACESYRDELISAILALRT